MTKNDLVAEIARKSGMEQQDVKKIVQMTLDGIVDILVSEKRFELRNFGIFEVQARKPRKARNPRSGEPVMVDARCVASFKPGKEMEARVAKMNVKQVQDYWKSQARKPKKDGDAPAK